MRTSYSNRNVLAIILIYLEILINKAEAKLYNPKTAVIELAAEHGYSIQQHSVTTEDGYILGVQRIPHGAKNTSIGGKPPVLLMHGLFGTAENWITMGPERSLGFFLADRGYDVWLGNARGTTHSRKHVRLNPDFNQEYWQFSWHEIGVYDLPAIINYVVNKTAQERIFYVGHSQGCTIFFAMASDRPEINERIRLMVGLAPSVFLGEVRNPILRLLANLGKMLNEFLTNSAVFEILPNNELAVQLRSMICARGTLTGQICGQVLATLFDGSLKTISTEEIYSAVISTVPAGASTKQLLHFLQIVRSGSFRHYDYGSSVNLKKYNLTQPPRYELERILAPIATFYSKGDTPVPYKGVEKLNKVLPNLVYSSFISDETFKHADFLLAQNVVEEINLKILELFQKY